MLISYSIQFCLYKMLHYCTFPVFFQQFFCRISHLTVKSNRTVQDFYVFLLKSLIAIHFLLPCKPDLIFKILFFLILFFLLISTQSFFSRSSFSIQCVQSILHTDSLPLHIHPINTYAVCSDLLIVQSRPVQVSITLLIQTLPFCLLKGGNY